MTQGFEILEFGSDTKLRKRFFTGESFSHPAKMHLSLQMYLIEHYTKAGETICDPMGGSGTLLMATTIGRNVICVELEQKFVDMAEANWQKIQRLGPMLGYTMGDAVIIQGDARDLRVLADKVVFSPPYALGEGLGHSEKNKSKIRKEKYRSTTYTDKRDKNNIGNLRYGKIDTVISSPPYSDSPIGGGLNTKPPREEGNDQAGRSTKSPSQKGAGKYDKADVICTSPPYEGTFGVKAGGNMRLTDLHKKTKDLSPEERQKAKEFATYSKSEDNIGNLKSDNYLTEMLKVYRQCYQVLKDAGLLVLVVKNFIRDKKIVRLDLDTIKLCETAGFTLKDQLARKLTQQSFWRRIYEQRYPDAPKIEFEDVLIFEKMSLLELNKEA